eukprot:scaffold78569_cov77-Cyclotella_meneghiniana.AAC.2
MLERHPQRWKCDVRILLCGVTLLKVVVIGDDDVEVTWAFVLCVFLKEGRRAEPEVQEYFKTALSQDRKLHRSCFWPIELVEHTVNNFNS